jgi:putative transposase
LRYRNSREILDDVKNVTISASNGKWFASVQTQREVEQSVAQGDAVGIDMGIVRFATFWDGTVIPPIHISKQYAADLRNAQQAVCSYCQRSSGLPTQSIYRHQQKPRDGRR